eukprot:537217_1
MEEAVVIWNWRRVEFNKFKCEPIKHARVEPIDVPIATRNSSDDCVDLAYVQETLHGNFEQIAQEFLGPSIDLTYVYKHWICPNPEPEPLSYKLEISFDGGVSYHIIGGFVGFRDNHISSPLSDDDSDVTDEKSKV